VYTGLFLYLSLFIRILTIKIRAYLRGINPRFHNDSYKEQGHGNPSKDCNCRQVHRASKCH
jgi:hypothetical protein